MGKVYVVEPSVEVRDLFALLLARLGHEAVVHSRNGASEEGIDVLLVEPADPDAFALARDLHRRRPEVPIVCASIEPKTSAVTELDPRAYLVKPFGLAELERALATALGPEEKP